jgi:serine/threonine protein kinase
MWRSTSMQKNSAEFIGQVLNDRYQIERQLGQKTGRRTFLAIDLQTELAVVIKLLIFSNKFRWDDLKLFEREAETLKHLDLPAIPRYLDYFEFDLPNLKGFALVQNHIDAPSLEQVVSSGRRFTGSELQELATSLLDILDYLHSLQPPVIHQDLKPSNILLTNRSGISIGDVYLVDFGSVQNVAAKDGGTMTVVGTSGYMPLEQFGGKTVPASDLYSLGATLIYTISGTHPAELLGDDGKIQIPVNNLSKSWMKWLETMTEISLKKRFPDVAAAKLALTRLDERASIVREKPYSSKIVLTKNEEAIDIFISARNSPIDRKDIIDLFHPVLFLTLTFYAYKIFDYWEFPPLFSLFVRVFHVFITYVVLDGIVYDLFGKSHLRIDKDLLTIRKRIGNIRWHELCPSIPRKDIDLLTYNLRPQTKGEDREVIIDKEIVIFAGVGEYRIDNISKAECEWLLAELSEWLDLPISK